MPAQTLSLDLAQEGNAWTTLGSPVLQTHPLSQTGETGQLRFACQMFDGLLAVGGTDGFHVFDGSEWENLEQVGASFSSVIGRNGHLYVGGAGALKELQATSGDREYLVRQHPVTGKIENRIEHLIGLDDLICGSFGKGLFVHAPGKSMRIFPLEHWVRSLAAAGHALYIAVNREAVSLYRVDVSDGLLTPVDLTSLGCRPDDPIDQVIPRDAERCWLVTESGRVYCFDGQRLLPAPWLEQDSRCLVHATNILSLPGGGYAIGTAGQGLLFCNHLGHIEYVLSTSNGLLDANIESLSLDREGGLWVGTLRSFHRLDARRRFINYAQRQGLDLPGARVVLRHRGLLYVAGSEGLFVQNLAADSAEDAFVRVNTYQNVSDILSGDEGLWIGSKKLYLLADDHVEVQNVDSVTSLLRRRDRPDELIIGTIQDLRVMVRRGSNWSVESVISTGGHTVYSLMETPAGELWCGLGTGRVGRVNLAETEPHLRIYDESKGVRAAWVDIAVHQGRIYLGVDSPRCLVYSEQSDSFTEDPGFLYYPGSGPYGFNPVFGRDEAHAWVKWKTSSGQLLPRPDQRVIGVLQNCEQNSNVRASGILDEGDEGQWICHPGGLLHVVGGALRDEDLPRNVPTLLRRVEDMRTGEILQGRMTGHGTLAINRHRHSIRVVAALPSFQGEQFTRYRIWLEGVDSTPPAWSPHATREFTTLPAGHYRLLVQARDMLGIEHDPVELALDVSPDPLLTPLAFVAYILLLLSLVWLLIRIRVKLLSKSNEELRLAVERRTAEAERTSKLLLEKNRQLEGILQDMEQLAIDAKKAGDAKTRFLAAMSHEIRTPMNGVIGMGALLAETRLDQEQRDYLSVIQSSAESLLSLINDILDYSKAASGKLSLEHLSFDLRSLIDEVLELLATQAAIKRLDLLLEIEASFTGGIEGDPIRLRQVLLNLLGNAIKFTERGQVTIRLTRTGRLPAPRVRIDIIDTGIGIPHEKMEVLFKPFSQVDSSTTRRYGGTGLGLAISRQIVDAMGGRIWVESAEGTGSTFSIEFPTELCGLDEGIRHDPLFCRHSLLLMPEGGMSRHLRSLMQGGRGELFVTAQLQREDLLPVDFEPELIFIEDQHVSELAVELQQREILRDRFPDVPVIILGNLMPDASLLGERRPVFSMGRPITRGALLRTIAKALAAHAGLPHRQGGAGEIPNLADIGSLHFQPFGDIGPLLLVEDNPVNQKTALLSLRRLGLEADLATNGLEALAAVSKKAYRIIFMDVHMPGMDGLEVTRNLRERFPAQSCPRIIIMTAGVMKEDLLAIEQVGVDAILAKPFRVSDMEKVLRECSERLPGLFSVAANRGPMV